MEFFYFTFKEGDRFKHTYKMIEKYVNQNIKKKVKLEWKPRVNIQVFSDRKTVPLEKDLSNLNRVYEQTLYIQVYAGMTLHIHVSTGLKYLANEKEWIVTFVNHDPFGRWSNLL